MKMKNLIRTVILLLLISAQLLLSSGCVRRRTITPTETENTESNKEMTIDEKWSYIIEQNTDNIDSISVSRSTIVMPGLTIKPILKKISATETVEQMLNLFNKKEADIQATEYRPDDDNAQTGLICDFYIMFTTSSFELEVVVDFEGNVYLSDGASEYYYSTGLVVLIDAITEIYDMIPEDMADAMWNAIIIDRTADIKEARMLKLMISSSSSLYYKKAEGSEDVEKIINVFSNESFSFDSTSISYKSIGHAWMVVYFVDNKDNLMMAIIITDDNKVYVSNDGGDCVYKVSDTFSRDTITPFYESAKKEYVD